MADPTGWDEMAWWRKVLYGIVAVPIALVPTSLTLLFTLFLPGPVSGLVFVAVLAVFVFLVMNYLIRPDVDYVDSDEYAARNSQLQPPYHIP